MATKKSTKSTANKKPAASAKSGETKVTRITASDSGKASKSTAKPSTKTAEVKTAKTHDDTSKKTRRRSPLAAIKAYLRGAWFELRQVRWPDRRMTWSMTGALIGFTLFFVVVILLLDAGFQYLFNHLIK